MFPFLNNNGYLLPPFPYNTNYDSFRASQIEISPYICPFINHSFRLHHGNGISNHFSDPQMPNFYDRNIAFTHE